ncbi:MAG TPA: cupin domain-containing protein [Solirubrobacterales bacterium]|nr:cupin domain-containing protein [Solirubrobacterales bacterium]
MQRINIAAPDFEYDGEDPEGFRAGMARLGKLLGAKESGVSVYELPPGQAVCPYHYECGEEEWLLVLSGRPTVRHPAGEERLEPWDVVCFPRGPEGAHGVRNDSEETVRVLMFSTVVLPTATVYPDSDKVGVWTGDPETDLVVRRESGVEYFDREPGTGR